MYDNVEVIFEIKAKDLASCFADLSCPSNFPHTLRIT